MNVATRFGTAAAALTAAIVAATGLTACSSSGGGGSSGTVTLNFQSLAFQKPTIAAVANIVSSFNKTHPKIHVNLVQGSWDTVHDKLVTQFEGGTAPDIIQDDAADIANFGQQGYLADLTNKLSPTVKSSIGSGVWKTVTQNGKIIAAPTLLQSYVVFANDSLLNKDGITAPSDTLSWDQLRTMAKSATKDGSYGLAWGLAQPTATMMTLGLNFGGTYFHGSGSKSAITVGDAETQVPERIHEMAYTDKSIAPVTLSQQGTDVLPGFYAGKYAMIVGGNYVAQQILEQAPKSFQWSVLPPLTGTSGNQAADPQILAVPAASHHISEATQFIDYFLSANNLAAVAQGDWLIPTSSAAQQRILQQTGGKNGWAETLAGAKYQVSAPFQSQDNYPQWKQQIAEPAFQQYLGNKITLSQLSSKLTSGWNDVNK